MVCRNDGKPGDFYLDLDRSTGAGFVYFVTAQPSGSVQKAAAGPIKAVLPQLEPGLPIRFVVTTVFPWVASLANMLYLAARTRNRATVCLHAARIAALREFWSDCLPTETLFFTQNFETQARAAGQCGPRNQGFGVD